MTERKSTMEQMEPVVGRRKQLIDGINLHA